jgi:hypothetical protein
MIKEFPFAKYHDEGIIEIFGNESGSPEITAVCPAPDVNTKDGAARQKKYDEACDGITLQGYLIVEKKMIRNEVFDDPGQKTTLQVRYRPCKTKSEIEQLHMQIVKILGIKGEFKGVWVGEVPK